MAIASAEPPVVSFDHVTVRFDDRAALLDASFEVSAGQTTVLFGAAGSGKTVLLKTAIGLLVPAEGRVHLFGRDITRLREEEMVPLRRRVGVLFQESGLFDSLTVEENIAYPILYGSDHPPPEAEVEAAVKQALDFVELAETIDQEPSELSGGMRRRVGIARATVTKPPLVLYDSPTAGLDPITAYRIMSLIIRRRDTYNTTSLLVTHRYQDARLMANYNYDAPSGKLIRTGRGRRSTRFLVLKQGRVVFQGCEDELQSSSDPYVARFAGKRTLVPTNS